MGTSDLKARLVVVITQVCEGYGVMAGSARRRDEFRLKLIGVYRGVATDAELLIGIGKLIDGLAIFEVTAGTADLVVVAGEGEARLSAVIKAASV